MNFKFSFILLAVLIASQFIACVKEEEPFQYPDNVITEPSMVTHMTRKILEAEGWQSTNVAEGCNPDFGTNTFAFTETNFTRGFATMYLVPDSSSCSTFVALHSPINASEVPSDYWDNWKLELAFTELQMNDATELRFKFHYREVELEINLAPVLSETFGTDTLYKDVSGLFVFEFIKGQHYFYLNGEDWNPDFENGNVLKTDADVSDPFIEFSLEADGTLNRSLFVFTYARVSSFGIPEN